MKIIEKLYQIVDNDLLQEVKRAYIAKRDLDYKQMDRVTEAMIMIHVEVNRLRPSASSQRTTADDLSQVEKLNLAESLIDNQNADLAFSLRRVAEILDEVEAEIATHK
jgi:hypothetical protein